MTVVSVMDAVLKWEKKDQESNNEFVLSPSELKDELMICKQPLPLYIPRMLELDIEIVADTWCYRTPQT
jgi:hypothetical protein